MRAGSPEVRSSSEMMPALYALWHSALKAEAYARSMVWMRAAPCWRCWACEAMRIRSRASTLYAGTALKLPRFPPKRDSCACAPARSSHRSSAQRGGCGGNCCDIGRRSKAAVSIAMSPLASTALPPSASSSGSIMRKSARWRRASTAHAVGSGTCTLGERWARPLRWAVASPISRTADFVPGGR
jgi:hypothetical protein